MAYLPEGRALMLYDGLCGFCNGTIRWVAKRDWRDRFRFAPQQTELAGAVLARHGIDKERTLSDNSVYLVLDYDSPKEQVLTRSDVTVHTLLLLGGGWRLLGQILGVM